jgi:hypothetical protein
MCEASFASHFLVAGISFLKEELLYDTKALHTIIGCLLFKLFFTIYILGGGFSIWKLPLKRPQLLSPGLALHENNIACVYTSLATLSSGPANLCDSTCNLTLAITYNKNNLLWNWLSLSSKPLLLLSSFLLPFDNYKWSRWEKEWTPGCNHNNICEDVLLLALRISF